MRTAILSDLHLGLTGGGDVLRDPDVRRVLFGEIAGADRVVLLGDVVELRERPLGPSLESARPFFEDLGEALGGAEVTIVPGNHDHRFAEPLLDRLSLDSRPLGLEQIADPSPGATETIGAWLGPARLRIAYPGVWLREDVYASHGHYLDAHLTLPRAEALAVSTLARLAGPVPQHASVLDYERITRPLYGLAYGAAQGSRARRRRTQQGLAERAWNLLGGDLTGADRAQRRRAALARRAFPLGVRGINRLLRADFDPDISPESISRRGVEAATEVVRRLGIGEHHVINGHTHRGGPYPEDGEWELPGGGRLHNTGSWVFASVFHHPAAPPNSYWPGTVTWLEDEEPPRRVRLLSHRSYRELNDVINRANRR
jgi:3',5'-cyclic AMP phosphodiesterase CpdA